MTLYYTFVFGILAIEMVMFLLLALPVPSKYRKPVTMALIRPFRLTQIQVAIKCILGFIMLLFVDTINRVYSINAELSQTSIAAGVSDRNEVQSRKFYAQRNMYLTGITLFLTFTVFRTYGLVWELLELKENYRTDSENMNIDDLKKQIEDADKEIKSLKERAEGLQAEMQSRPPRKDVLDL
ncbi:LAME_0E07646g1_1 [Lachancea meyersii CBS 8951]|uniref:Endoplasmic reticulum transmembrane protein n=1 Tax=Lachancea meyersii CBS 8951 TaxID=1266667 RepID=A0A1G4JIT4_9SACH|nr:LAME_0E07646g1_1 [Lachancea meyersii CBS 8951]